MVTPEFAEAMDPNEVPPCGPGQLTAPPTDVELYYRGYLEVPKKCDNGNCGPGGPGSNLAPVHGPESVGPGYPASGPQGAQSRQPAPAYPGQSTLRQSSQPVQKPTPAKTVASNSNMKTALQSSAPQRSASSQNQAANYSYYAGSTQTGAKPSQQPQYQQQYQQQPQQRTTQPALIGPLGYDELK
jgi:pilus assembly protein CpaC